METLRNIPFSPPDITEEEIAEVAAALRDQIIKLRGDGK